RLAAPGSRPARRGGAGATGGAGSTVTNLTVPAHERRGWRSVTEATGRDRPGEDRAARVSGGVRVAQAGCQSVTPTVEPAMIGAISARARGLVRAASQASERRSRLPPRFPVTAAPRARPRVFYL